MGLMQIGWSSGSADRPGVPASAVKAFQRGCASNFPPACENANQVAAGGGVVKGGPPTVEDYAVLLQGGKGPIRDRRPSALYARACSQGWAGTCDAD